MMLQQDRKVKQQYLRQQILDKNYNAQEFISFLNVKLNIDSDLGLCSMEQLKQVVKLFIQEKENTIVDKYSEIQRSMVIKREMKNQAIIFVNNVNRQKDYEPPIIEESFQKQYKCLKIIPKYNKDTLCKMKCIVSKQNIHQNSPERKYVEVMFGIGTSSFLQFQVKTEGVDWCVGRRYSDFIWIRSILKKFYPSQIIPPIPNKKAHKRTSRHIQKRMRILTYFLNDLLKIPEIVNSKYFQGFLSLKDPSKFERLKKEADNKQVFESIVSSQTQTGMVTISLSNENKNYYDSLKKFANKSQLLYKQVTRASKRFQSLRIDEINQLYQMGIYVLMKVTYFHSYTKKENNFMVRQKMRVYLL